MSLTNKVAVVFAGSGAIASAVTRRLAHDGATVVVTARKKASLEGLVSELTAGNARVFADEADALNPADVTRVLDDAVRRHGRLDIVFNGIGGRPRDLGYPARTVETPLSDFMIPMERIVGSQFLTAREAAKRMPKTGGSIVMLSATLSGMTAQHMAGISAACGAVEALTRALAGDFGAHHIRVNCVRGSAMPETRTIHETGAGIVALGSTPPMTPPPLGRPITTHETANAVSFLASDAASGMTGQVLTVCAGAFV